MERGKFKTNAYGYVEEIEFQPSLTKNSRDSRQTAVGKKGLPEDVGGIFRLVHWVGLAITLIYFHKIVISIIPLIKSGKMKCVMH